jgi:subtilisin family serine protease
MSLTTGIMLDSSSAAPKPKDERSLRHQKVANDLRDRINGNAQETLKVIVQLNAKASPELAALFRSNGVKIRKRFVNFNTIAAELPAGVVDSLASFPEVEFVSVDSKVQSFGGHVAHTTGTDNVRQMGTTTLDGSGVGIAVLDSGIYQQHVAFLNPTTNTSRIVVNLDFTGEGRTDDPYGHGTHVASAAAGNGMVSSGKYIGIAPRANLLNLRVLNSQGVGNVSSLLAALDWVMSNRTTYNIRVVNMSLGMPAVNSYKYDPVCVASRQLVDAGVVVVAAAGNNGKQSDGTKLYGQIHSPGNEPAVLTVGAVDTKGTDYRGDDGIATYSSRGPTRSYWVDDNGGKHYDNLVKPEISAPGNKLIFAKSPNNLLSQQNPLLNVNVSTDPTRAQMLLSGTSMAAPLAAGTAALMLEANPSLTPNLIKMSMMYTAQLLPNFS